MDGGRDAGVGAVLHSCERGHAHTWSHRIAARVTLAAGSANVARDVLVAPHLGIIAAAVNTLVGFSLLLAGVFGFSRRLSPAIESRTNTFESRGPLQLLLRSLLPARRR